MKIKTIPLAGVVLAVFSFGIAGVFALGYWVAESKKSPAKIESSPLAGQNNPADIQGSYTFGDVEDAFGVPSSILAEAFDLMDRPAAEVKAGDLETAYTGKTGAMELGTDSVRLFVAAWLGIPFEPEPTTALTARAAAILQERRLHPATAALVQSRVVTADAGFGTLSAAAPSEEAAPIAPISFSPPAAREVRGNTTFGALFEWGLSRAQVKEVLGGRNPGPATETVRNYCIDTGVEFSVIRVRLQEVISRLTKP